MSNRSDFSIAQLSNTAVSVENRSRNVFDVLTVFAGESWKSIPGTIFTGDTDLCESS
jgi:hypothetical protein